MNSFHKILIPIDFAPHSAEAVQRAIELASHSTAELVLVHFHDPNQYPIPTDSIAYTPAQLERMAEPLRRRLDAVARGAESMGARSVTSRLSYGDPAVGIVAIAAEEGFDLVVMGTHGRTGLSRWVLGSVTEKVVRGAPCAVLTVKAPARAAVANASVTQAT